MSEIKEVTVFTNGDSSKISTWSNVPYFFTETLLAKGIRVNRVDLKAQPLLNKIHNAVFWRALKIIKLNGTYTYFRSLIHFINVRRRIKKAIKQYPNADANVFLTFTFCSAGLSDKPTIQFGDWTYDYYLKNFESRPPDFFERLSIKREDSQIESSDLVFSLFPKVAEYMKTRYQNKNIFYLGNVINSLYPSKQSDIIEKKLESNDLLFVGNKHYLCGAKCLIEAFRLLKNQYPQLKLHIVGLDRKNFESLPEDVKCYGYLDKGKADDRDLYYSLFESAKIFINTTPNWAAFSATVEAMYFYIPLIVTRNPEFVATFGKELTFGYYCDNNAAMLGEKIKKVLEHEQYNELCVNSHNSVKQYTWSAYIDKVMEKIGARLAAGNGGVGTKKISS